MIRVTECLQMRSLRIAEWSPAGAEVKDDIAPLQRFETQGATAGLFEIEHRRRSPIIGCDDTPETWEKATGGMNTRSAVIKAILQILFNVRSPSRSA